MTFSYGDPSEDLIYEIRFLLQDTTEATAHLSDEEINYAIGKWWPLYKTAPYVASQLAETIAAKYSREASYSADGVSVSLGPVGQQYRELAASLREQHRNLLIGGVPDVGGITLDEQPDPTLKPTAFGTGMHDDPEVGGQDYGYGQPNPYYIPEYHPGS